MTKLNEYLDRVYDALVSTGGDIGDAADKLNISEDQLQKFINITEGISEGVSNKELREAENASHYSEESFRQEGTNFLIVDYEYYNGQEIPIENPNAEVYYQIIIKGSDDNEGERKFTTTIYESLEDALDGADEVLGRYSGAAYTGIFVRTLTRM